MKPILIVPILMVIFWAFCIYAALFLIPIPAWQKYDPADLNRDGKVDIVDYSILSAKVFP